MTAIAFGEGHLAGPARERPFDLALGDGPSLPGILWTPADAATPRPLIFAGHGFQLSKRSLFPRDLTAHLVGRYNFAVAAIDAPGHGDRQPNGAHDYVAVERDWRAHWRRFGATIIAAEWSAVIDALALLPEIDATRLGYWGLSLATHQGVGILAREPRIRAAVLGLSSIPDPGPRIEAYAPRVRCPVFFIQQLDDEVHPRERALALYELLGTEDKSLHASPGRHEAVPAAVFAAAFAFLAARLNAAN
jgi:pimeloyl-ACP methyl ester carboxylesterase